MTPTGDTSKAVSASTQAQPQSPFSSVLCAVDGKEGAYEAVEHAAALTGPGGRLTLLGMTSYRLEGDLRSPAIPPLEMKEILDKAAGIARAAKVQVVDEVDPASPPADAILDWSVDYDLLAVGAPSNPWLRGLFVAGVGDTALGALVTPVLFARRCDDGGRADERVLIASDGLDGHEALIDAGARVIAGRRSEVTLLHAVGPGNRLRPRRSMARARRLELQLEKLESAAPRHVELRQVPGSAADVIVDAAAQTEASLILMGTRRLNGLRAIGSVSRQVVHKAQSSVLLVPPQV